MNKRSCYLCQAGLKLAGYSAIALAAALLVAGCTDNSKKGAEIVIGDLEVGASRVAPGAAGVVSGIRLEGVITEVVTTQSGETQLRLKGKAVNEGARSVKGLELSLTFEQPEGRTIGGKLVDVYFEPELEPSTSEPFVLEVAALPEIRPDEPVHTRDLILKALENEPAVDSMIINRRPEELPARARQDDSGDGPPDILSEEASSTADMEEREDGDEHEQSEGDGG